MGDVGGQRRQPWARARRTHLAWTSVAAAAVLGIGAAISDAGSFPTQTKASVVGVNSNGSVTFSVSVSAGVPNVSRGGPVTFTDTTSNTVLGTVSFGNSPCTSPSVKVCTGTLTVP